MASFLPLMIPIINLSTHIVDRTILNPSFESIYIIIIFLFLLVVVWTVLCCIIFIIIFNSKSKIIHALTNLFTYAPFNNVTSHCDIVHV